MNNIPFNIGQLLLIERATSQEHGPYRLFALALREDANAWDLLVSAQWLDENPREGSEYMANVLVKHLNDKEVSALGGVVVLKLGDSILGKLLKTYVWEHAPIIVEKLKQPLGINIELALIITCQWVNARHSERLMHIFIDAARANKKVPQGVGFIIYDLLNEPPSIVGLKKGVTEQQVRRFFPANHVLMVNKETRDTIEQFMQRVSNPNIQSPVYVFNTGVVTGSQTEGEVRGQLTLGTIDHFKDFVAEVERRAGIS